MCANTLLYIHQRLEGFCSRPDMYLDINEVDSGNNSREMDPLRNAEKKKKCGCSVQKLRHVEVDCPSLAWEFTSS